MALTKLIHCAININVQIEWGNDKNEWLKANRSICFEQVKAEIEAGRFIGPEENPARLGQKRVVVHINGYPYAVPFVVEPDGSWFLKTAYPCRKMKGRL